MLTGVSNSVLHLRCYASAGCGCLRAAPPKDEGIRGRFPSNRSLFHSVFDFRRVVARAAYGLAVGMVRDGIIGNALSAPCCTSAHRSDVLEATF